MHRDCMNSTWKLMLSFVVTAMGFCPGRPALAEDTVIVLDEDWSGFRPGLLTDVSGANTEYHYLADTAPHGRWAVSTFRFDSPWQRAWRVIESDGARAMYQSFANPDAHCHPMLVSGDPAWSDYAVEVQFTPESDQGQSGVAFRYRNDRCYYFVGVDGPRAVLKLVRHESAFRTPFEKVLAEKPFDWRPGQRLSVSIGAEGEKLLVQFGSQLTLDANDDTFTAGKVALISDVPTRFHRVEISMGSTAKERVDEAIAARQREEAELEAALPRMVVWKKLSTDGFGVGRSLRFGDLNGDGRLDVLVGQVRNHGPKDRNSEVQCLTALTFEGEQLWQIGDPDPWANKLTSDVAFQIHDLDGDGRNEVVFTKNMEIVVVEGASGKLIRKAPTPVTPARTEPPYNRFPRILGDALYFCDLQGAGHDGDIILKDRYRSVWALDDQLQIKWHAQCTTGHYPCAEDVDGDGRDELTVGYTLFDGDGKVRWTLDGQVQDHADGLAWVRFEPEGPYRLLCAASDEGLFFADTAGGIRQHHRVGHAQNASVADFRPDLPGLEAVSINFWGNQGIIHLYNAAGEIYHDFEPCQHGSMCLPVNWSGEPGELFVLSPNVEEGGLYDGWGRRALRFPADGHPDMCYAVVDITGDCRDEIVVWDPYEIWVYTQSDSPLSGRLYLPRRNPLYNYSNYQTTVSLPGWSDEQ